MACPGCGKVDRTPEKTVNGNIPGTDSPQEIKELEQEEAIKKLRALDEAFPNISDMTYVEYRKVKSEYIDQKKAVAGVVARSRSEDFKRIQIHDLVMIYNYEEFSPYISPHQAIVALWELSHDKAFTKVFDEFSGLSEQVDLRYKEIKDKNIKLNWKL